MGQQVPDDQQEHDVQPETDEEWKQFGGAMKVVKAGKTKQKLRVVVLAEEIVEGKQTMVEVLLKPSMLARKLLIYLICLYLRKFAVAAEAIMMTLPGK